MKSERPAPGGEILRPAAYTAMLPEVDEVATVVVCEDDEATLELLCDHLEADRYKPLPAPCASDALRLCHYKQPDLLLLDLRLPDASGLDVLREIRATDGSNGRFDPSLPVMVLSGRSSPADRVRGLAEGADDYVVKPFAYEELVWRLRAVLRRRSQRRQGPRRIGDLLVDPSTREVKVGGRRVELANKEFGMFDAESRTNKRPTVSVGNGLGNAPPPRSARPCSYAPDMESSEPSGPANQRVTWIASSLPGLVALVLGIVYLAGAITKVAQLSGAGLEPRDVFPLIPIEQLLTRGLQVLISLEVILVFVPIVLLLVFEFERAEPETRERGRWVIALSGVSALLVVLISPPEWLAGFAVAALLGGLVAFSALKNPGWARGSERRRRIAVAAVLFVAVTVFIATAAIVRPQPLPDATLDTRYDGQVSGPLVTYSDGNWIVGTESGGYRIVPQEQVRGEVVEKSSDRGPGDSLFERITGLQGDE